MAFLYPTVAVVPPRLAEVAEMENARRVNYLCLRNTATVNYFNGCAISLPCHRSGEAPVGLMLSTRHGSDETLFQLAAGVESALARV